MCKKKKNGKNNAHLDDGRQGNCPVPCPGGPIAAD